MKRSSGQNIVSIVVLLLVITVAIAFIIKAAKPKLHPRPTVDWTCEDCGHRFVDEGQQKPRECPECGGEAVLATYYYCTVHNHIFEAYRSKPDPDWELEAEAGRPMPGPTGGNLFKVPGGEWEARRPEIICPEGNADSATLERCPPYSERRQQP